MDPSLRWDDGVNIMTRPTYDLLLKNGTVWTRYHDTGRWEMDPEQSQRMSDRPDVSAARRRRVDHAQQLVGEANVALE